MTTTIKNALSDLNNAIASTMSQGSYLTLEIGCGLDDIKTITASISSGAYSDKIDYCSITGVITRNHHELKDFYNAMSIKREVLLAFRELMFSINSLLSNNDLLNMRYKQGFKAFNAVIKPWGVELTHLCETDVVTVSRMKNSDKILMESTNKDKAGAFSSGDSRNEQESAYETFLAALFDVYSSETQSASEQAYELTYA